MLRNLIVLLSFVTSASASAVTLQDLSSLHGCWRGDVQGATLTSIWTANTAGVMFGSDVVTDSSGQRLGWSSMAIVEEKNGIQFLYSEPGEAAQVFELKSFTGSAGDIAASFENDAAKGISKVLFSVVGNKTYRVQLSGTGKEAGLDLTIFRVSSTAECP